ncbi:3-isopropylmalate dehydratase large subunit like [Melia azedarach]|uniref:3-isopropylmalate dehydratase large subunit like n=1 Tax=Melia azedarach TaxID=155640 RepID=A0ACC1XXW7_MELAZ|nr:3-isopropylmalate dehydratase large subunit like [Melia azedarach]
MKSKAKKQSKLMQIMLAPIRILIIARDSYVKSTTDCVVGVNGAIVCPAPQISHVPKNFGVNNSDKVNDEKLRELLRQVSSKRSIGGVAKLNLQLGSVGNNGVGRSYSVGIGKIGRIDEEKPCYFEEDLLYPRSRSH